MAWPNQHRSLQGAGRGDASTGLPSPSWLNHHLRVKSSWSCSRPRPLSHRQLGGPALPVASKAPTPVPASPRHAGHTQQPPTLLGASPLLIRASVPTAHTSTRQLTGLLLATLQSPPWSGAAGAALCGRRAVTTETRGAGHGARRWSFPQGQQQRHTQTLTQRPPQPDHNQSIRRAEDGVTQGLQGPAHRQSQGAHAEAGCVPSQLWLGGGGGSAPPASSMWGGGRTTGLSQAPRARSTGRMDAVPGRAQEACSPAPALS